MFWSVKINLLKREKTEQEMLKPCNKNCTTELILYMLILININNYRNTQYNMSINQILINLILIRYPYNYKDPN